MCIKPKYTYTLHTCTHVDTHTHTSLAAYKNTDGHRPATSVSPSVNPCETDSNPSTGHTDSAIIPLNKLIQSRHRLPQAVGTATHTWDTSGAYRLLVNCCYSASRYIQKRHLQKWREVKSAYMCEWVCGREFNWMGLSPRTGDISAGGGVGRTPITAPCSWKLDGRQKIETPLHYQSKPSAANSHVGHLGGAQRLWCDDSGREG